MFGHQHGLREFRRLMPLPGDVCALFDPAIIEEQLRLIEG
jgi:hypothetical protein